MAHRFYRGHLTTTAGKFNGHVVTRPERLDIPLRRKKPTVYSLWNDLFHEAVDDEFIRRVFLLMAHGDVQQHTFLMLTKRPERMARAMNGDWPDTDNIIQYHMPQVWAGVTVCNQDEADEKIPELLKVPGKKWLSIEPMLGPIHLDKCVFCPDDDTDQCFCEQDYYSGIDAVVLGGETGPGARPCNPEWALSVKDQCAAAGVPFFFKGFGKYRGPHPGWYQPSGRVLDGQEWDELPWGKGRG